MPKVKERKSPATKAPKLDYHLEVTVNEQVFKGDANSLAECIKMFVDSPVFPFAVKSMVVLNYSKGGGEVNQRIFSAQKGGQVFRLIADDSHELGFLADKLEKEIDG